MSGICAWRQARADRRADAHARTSTHSRPPREGGRFRPPGAHTGMGCAPRIRSSRLNAVNDSSSSSGGGSGGGRPYQSTAAGSGGGRCRSAMCRTSRYAARVTCRIIWFWLRFREAVGLPIAAKINVQPCGGRLPGDVFTGVADVPHAAFGCQGRLYVGTALPTPRPRPTE